MPVKLWKFCHLLTYSFTYILRGVSTGNCCFNTLTLIKTALLNTLLGRTDSCLWRIYRYIQTVYPTPPIEYVLLYMNLKTTPRSGCAVYKDYGNGLNYGILYFLYFFFFFFFFFFWQYDCIPISSLTTDVFLKRSIRIIHAELTTNLTHRIYI